MSKVNEIKAASKEHIESELLMAEPITREEVLERSIPWEMYVSANKITKEDLELVTGFDKKALNTKYDLIDSVILSKTIQNNIYYFIIFLNIFNYFLNIFL